MTLSIYFIVLVIVLGTLALGWSFYRRQQYKPAPERGRSSHSMPLPGKHTPALRTRLGSALVALSFAGLTLLLGPQPHALAASASPQIQTTLTAGQYLTNDHWLVAGPGTESSGGNYFALMQDDGNFVVYKGTGPTDNHGVVWATGTGGHPNTAWFAIMQGDGNFCVYHGTGPSNNLGALWCSGTNGSGATQARLDDDGNFIIGGPTKYTPSPVGPILNADTGTGYYEPYPIVWSSLSLINFGDTSWPA